MRRFQNESIMQDERLVSDIALRLPEVESQLSGARKSLRNTARAGTATAEARAGTRNAARAGTRSGARKTGRNTARAGTAVAAARTGTRNRRADGHTELRDPVRATQAIREVLDREPRLEAMVQRLGRPTLLVRNDTFEVPQIDTWRGRLYPTKSRLDAAIRSVGRLEVTGMAMPYAATAWIIAPNIAVTNRHAVADLVRKRAGEFAFRPSPIGQKLTARLGFREEYAQVRPYEVGIKRVMYLADGDADAPDLAFVELEAPQGRQLPPPIPLYAGEPEPGQVVALIGYPLEDARNSLLDEARIFGGVQEVKRLAPGQVVDRLNRRVFAHDCTTLGDNSGSVVIDVTTGAALGLHFAGDDRDAGYAVSISEVRRHLELMQRGRGKAAEAMRPVLLRLTEVTRPEPEEAVPLSAMRGRTGYEEKFLKHKVPLPKLSAGLAELATVVDRNATGMARFLLQYEHFSVAMHRERRMAIFTAVNIDGGSAKKIKRENDRWGFDPRIAKSQQVGNELYAGNDLDRGHLVRRLDPAWGTSSEAKRAEVDTFFFTNSTPQHSGFNQKLWLELEDYLLGHASTLGFRACVFTGPLFSEQDAEYRGVLLPNAYWKVATMVNTETEELTATGYIVSQADLITDIEFVFGQVRTYQVPLARIEELTGLRFGTLKAADPMEGIEAVPGVPMVQELKTLDDIRL